MPQPAPIHLLQITDTHLFATADGTMRGCATAQTLQALLERICPLDPRPDALLLTGDLSQDETAASYQRLRAMIAPLGIPTYWIPGNHDHPGLMADALSTPPFAPEKSIALGNWTILLLDTQEQGQVTGRLSPASLTWLADQLQQTADRPTLITMHHPPCEIGSAWMDALRLQNADEFYGLIDRHPQIRAVLFGHIHQAFETTRRGIPYLGCPSSCIQFQPQSPTLVMDKVGPGCRRLRLDPDGRVETQVWRA